MRALAGNLVSKVGAEGVYTGVLPVKNGLMGWGLLSKLRTEMTAQGQPSSLSHSTNGVLNDEALEAVSKYAFFPVRNRNGKLSERLDRFKLNRELW